LVEKEKAQNTQNGRMPFCVFCAFLRLFLCDNGLNKPQRLSDLYIHTNPFVTGAAVAIHAAGQARAFDANVRRAGAAVAPPLGRAEDAGDGRSGGNSQMRRAGVAADVGPRLLRQRVKAFQRRANSQGAAALRGFHDPRRQFLFAGAVSHE
jgi:hypothetical protein